MAVCDHCRREMTDRVGCSVDTYDDFADGIPRPRITNGPDRECRDCGAPRLTLHHPGCHNEICPRCGFQAISCGCEGPAELPQNS